jgi:DNA-binding NtrC family response regulator
LNVFHISLPPLRARKSDIPVIAPALIGNLNQKHSCRVTQVSEEALARLREYDWPGNVRELRNVLERAVIVAGEGEIQLRHLTGLLNPLQREVPDPRSEDTLQIRVGDRLDEIEEAYIRMVLKHTNNNKTRTAAIVGISLRGLHNRLNTYEEQKAKGISAPATPP